MAKRRDEPDPFDVVDEFVDKISKTAGEVIVSIDPGASGAIGFLSATGRTARVIDIPNITVYVTRSKALNKKEKVLFEAAGKPRKTKTVHGSTTKPDYGGICEVFKRLRPLRNRIVVVLEQVPPSLGPGRKHAEIMLNRAYAMWGLFLHSHGYTVEEIRPSDWKAKMGLTGKDKNDSRLKAMALFPKAGIHLVKHHDRAEALLMGECVRRLRRANV